MFEVTCLPAPDVSEATTQHLYLNRVLPLVLSKLGKLVFHASAVEVAGGPWVQPVLRACYAASGSPKSASLAADPG